MLTEPMFQVDSQFTPPMYKINEQARFIEQLPLNGRTY